MHFRARTFERMRFSLQLTTGELLQFVGCFTSQILTEKLFLLVHLIRFLLDFRRYSMDAVAKEETATSLIDGFEDVPRPPVILARRSDETIVI